MTFRTLRLGLLSAAVLLVLVSIAAPRGVRDADAAVGSWTGRYYDNLTLSGAVDLTFDEGPELDLFFLASPGAGIPADNWSASYTRTDTYTAGTYRITVTGDDGVRVFVDNTLRLNAWVDQGPTKYFTDVALTAGSHTVRVELYDSGNAATLTAAITNLASMPQGWQGQYFTNPDLAGAPSRTRNDGENIEFQWNATAPGSPFPGVIPNDGFSARWTRTMDFSEGVYQFTTLSDDGVRVYVDGQLIIDYWIDQAPTEHSANKQMTAGPHTVVVEYYEAVGGASMFLNVDYRPDLGGFVTDVIFDGLPVYTATAFAFAPDGRIFFAYKNGEVKVWDGVTLHNYYTVPNVNTYVDRGLLGLALDPAFATNGWVYLAYTHEQNANDDDGEKTNKVIRVRANTPAGNLANATTRQTLLGSLNPTAQSPSCDDWPANSDCIPGDAPSHMVGNLKFGPDGMLYVTTGDGASYTTVDRRALRTLDVTSLAGKILRVNPATGAGVAGNPFYTGDAEDNASKVWAMGLRNGFRFNFKPGTNVIFNGDVGWGLWEEINVITAGDNLGWPCYEGPFVQEGYAAEPECDDLYDSGGTTDAIHWYEHPPDSAVVGGSFTGANGYSSPFQNTYFFGDYARDEISVLKVDGSNNVIPGSVDVFTSAADGPVQIETGPDGNIYYLSLITGELRRIRYIGDNRPPVAVAGGAPTAGPAPLTVNFSSAGSNDPDAGQAITYAWDFGDGETSTLPNPSHQYQEDGDYTATLTVTDPFFTTGVDTVEVSVGNNAPVAQITSPSNGGTYEIGSTIAFSGTGIDAEDGALEPADLQWTITLVHCNELAFINCHQHVVATPTGVEGSFIAADHGDFTYYDVALTVTDSGGLEHSQSVSIAPVRVNLTFTSNRSGVQIVVNGTGQTTPFVRSVPKNSQHTLFAPSPQNVDGGNAYFSAWSDGGAQQHIITALADATYTANFVDPTPTSTNVPGTGTATPTPTQPAAHTSTPTATATPDLTDSDGDGVANAVDNCIDVQNLDQLNSNAEPMPLPAPILFEDATNPITSSLGDACNPDIDADRLPDDDELSNAADPAKRDTDGDLALDGAEVVCGSDPADPESLPTGTDSDFDLLPDACEAQIGSNPNARDSDGDGLADGLEYLRVGTDPLQRDTDGDDCRDPQEAGSVNGDRAVNSSDLGQIALRFSPPGGPAYLIYFDVNKDGMINSIDLGLTAQQFGPCAP